MPRSRPTGGGNKDNELQIMSFDNLTIADFEDDDDDVGRGNISDLESVADLPDEPSNTSHAGNTFGSRLSSHSSSTSSSFRSSHFTVNVSKPSATRAVYTVPTVVNFQDWEASRSWTQDDRERPNKNVDRASAVPMLTRLLILKNVDICSHCAVISAPLTERFGLVARRGGSGARAGIGGTKAPFKLVLEPGASCTFDVLFFQPDDEELKFWDNFRDAVVIYTERYSITVPFRALRTGRDCAPSSFTPSIEAMVLPQKPQESQFSAMLSGREAGVKVIPGPGGFGQQPVGAPPRAAVSTRKVSRAEERTGQQVSPARAVPQEANKKHALTDSEEDETSPSPTQDHEHDVAGRTGGRGPPAPTHQERRRPAAQVVATEREQRRAPSPPPKVLAVNSDDAAALILQMRRKLQQTAPQPGKFGGSPTRRGQGRSSPTSSATSSPSAASGSASGSQESALAVTTNSAESIRRFQEEALSSRHARSAADDEQEFYRSLMRRDVTRKKTVASSTAQRSTPHRGLAIARGGSLTTTSPPRTRPKPTQVGHQRIKTPGPQSKQPAAAGPSGRSVTSASTGRDGKPLLEQARSSPRRRNTAATAASSRESSTSADSSKLQRHRTEPSAGGKKPTIQHAADEVDFYRSLIQKQKVPLAKQLPPRASESRIRPQSQQQDSNTRIGLDADEAPEEWVAEYDRRLAAAKSSSPILGEREHASSSPVASLERRRRSTQRDGERPVLNALRHPYGGSRKQKPPVVSATIRRQRDERTTAYRPGQRITVRAPVRRRHVS